MFNQTSSVNSEFKVPQAPQPQRTQTESLLFNDILEEINTAVRTNLSEFLQVLPYRMFNMELNNFFKRTNRLRQEAQQNGANISRLTNCSQLVLTNSRPSSSFNYRAPSTMSMISCNLNRQPENSFQPHVPLNPFKPPVHTSFPSNEIVLPRINQSSYSQSSSNMCTTIVEVDHGINKTTVTNHNLEHLNPPEPISKCASDPANTYSDMTIVDQNKSVSASRENKNINGSNSIDSLLEAVGFKINVGLPDNTKTTKSDANENNCKILEKYLSKWSVDLKIIKSKKSSLILTGTLLEADLSTVVEKHHNAGFVTCRKATDLLKTSNGLYRLVGNIISGSPDELYQECLLKNGVPMRWRRILDKYFNVNNGMNKARLDFSLDSPAATITVKATKKPNLDISMTRAGKIYSQNVMANRKRKNPDSDPKAPVKRKTNSAAFYEKLPMLASTPKRPKKRPAIYDTPTQILKNKISQNIQQQTNTLALKRIDDSICITKKRRSFTKEQAGKLLKLKSPTPQSNSSIRCSKQNKSNSTERKIKNLKNNIELKNKTPENSAGTTMSNNSKQQSSLKLSKNSTKSSTFEQSSLKLPKNSTKSSILEQSSLKLSINSTESSLKQAPLTERNVKALQPLKSVKEKSTKNMKIVKPNIKISPEFKKKDLKNQVAKKQKKVRAASPGSGIFENINLDSFGENNNINIMLSPSRLSVMSGSEKSRCETPPLFGHQWSSSAKSIVLSEPPTPLGKSVDAKALKRVHPPKITMEEELKNNKKMNKVLDFQTASKKINKLLQFGEELDDEY